MNAQVTDDLPAATSRRLIAPGWHTVLMLCFVLAPLVSGFLVQSQPTAGHQVLSDHASAMMRFYLPVLGFEWFLVFFVWLGVRLRGASLADLIGGRWKKTGSVVLDVVIGLAVWGLLLAIGAALSNYLPPDAARKINVLMPQSPLEMAIWVAVASTAGFVEELVFRGYLQTQFVRMGLPTILAIAAQALVFGLGHAYEGLNAVAVITVYAVLFGMLAALRRSLRPGMIGHVIFDVSVVFLMGA